MIGHLRDEIEGSRKTSFSDLFADGKPAEISRDFEPTAPFILFTCVVLHKPRFGAGQQLKVAQPSLSFQLKNFISLANDRIPPDVNIYQNISSKQLFRSSKTEPFEKALHFG